MTTALRRSCAPRLLVAWALLVVAAGCSKEGTKTGETNSAASAAHSTEGVIKSFAPDRKLANIAHENIPGYMSAMTMSFEATSPAQLEGLAVGDKVAFTFTAEGGKHVLASIKKEP